MSDSIRFCTVQYCHRCRFFFRASWVQTELWQTFPPPEIAAITLIPHASDESGSAGIFRITLDGTRVWDRKEMGGFPEMRALVSCPSPLMLRVDVQLADQGHRYRNKLSETSSGPGRVLDTRTSRSTSPSQTRARIRMRALMQTRHKRRSTVYCTVQIHPSSLQLHLQADRSTSVVTLRARILS